MKNLLILFAVSCALLSSCRKDKDPMGPPKTQTVCRMAEWKNTIANYSFVYTTDANNDIVQSIYFGDKGEVALVSTYEYRDGRLSALKRYFDTAKTIWNGSMTFADSGNKIYWSTYTNRDHAPYEIMRQVFTVDGEGKLVSEQRYTVKDGELTPRERIEYDTDGNGNVTEARTYWDSVLTETWTYSYDAMKNVNLTLPEYTILKTGKNNVVDEVQTKKDGTVKTYAYQYTYNAEGYPVTRSDGTIYMYTCREK